MIVFDLDHTLLSANSSFRFGLFLYRKNFFPFWTLLACLTDYARHKWLGMSLQNLHTRTFSRLFKGRTHLEISSHADQFLNENLSSLLFQPVFKRLKEAQSQEQPVLILSSSPDFLVREIAKRLEVNQWKGTPYLLDPEGRFCAISTVIDGVYKALYVKNLSVQLSLPLSAMTAYSDSALDLPLLTLVGRPIAVNPDSRLKKHCQKRGWEILSA